MQVISELRIGVKLRKVREEEELCDPSQQQQDHQHQSSSSSSSSVVKFKAREATASSGQQRRHVEYELTPFEILLDQIRTRRYHLKKVATAFLSHFNALPTTHLHQNQQNT